MSGILPLLSLLVSLGQAAPPAPPAAGASALAPAGIELHADLPAPLQEALALSRVDRHLTASARLYDLLVSGDWPDHESRIRYELGRSLLALNFPHAADHFFLSILHRGTDDPMFDYALLKTMQTAQVLGDDASLRRIAPRIADVSALPESTRSTILYFQGLDAYADANLHDALAALASIAVGQPRWAEALYLRAVIHSEQEKLKSAVRAFRDIAMAPPELDVSPALRAHAVLNIARIYYSIEQFETADAYYRQVPRDSDVWVVAVYERAWAGLMQNDTEATLGDLLTVESPYFSAHTHFPEATLLRAISYFQVCDDGGIQTSLAAFSRQSLPVRAELDALIADHRLDSGARAEVVWQHYFGPGEDVQTALPDAFFAEAFQNNELADTARHLRRLADERDRLEAQRRDGLATLGPTLSALYAADQVELERRAGRLLLSEAARTVAELDALATQADIIRLEALTAQYHALQRRVDATLERGRVADHPREVGLLWGGHRSWVEEPFNGEFWEDELGYYRYTVPALCP